MFPITSILYKRLENVAKIRYEKINKLEKIDIVIDKENEDNDFIFNRMINEVEDDNKAN